MLDDGFNWQTISKQLPCSRDYLIRFSCGSQKFSVDVIARGVFTSVADIRRKLMRYMRQYGKEPNHEMDLPKSITE